MVEKKLVALTFDDGPTPGITDQVLDVLEANQVVPCAGMPLLTRFILNLP